MALSTKSFTQLVSDAAKAAQGYASSALDMSVGSVFRAGIEATMATVVWLVRLILEAAALTRASTSNDADLDTWMADFNLKRLPAEPATGIVTFSRFTATAQAVIPVGTLVQTTDGTQRYAVVMDSTMAYYVADQNAYVLPPAVASAQAAIQAVDAGSLGNAVAGAISVIAQSLPGVDQVTNAAGLTSGADAESDVAFRVRFQSYLQSLSRGTVGAIEYAVESFREGLTCTVVENQNRDGSAHLGYFYVVVDDGTGSPSDTLVAGVYNAVDAVRAATISFSVFPPTVDVVNVSLAITTAAGYDHAATAALVQTTVAAYVNALPLGAGLPLTRIAQVAYDTSAAVTNVTNVTLNGSSADIPANSSQVIKTGVVGVA